MLPGQLAGLQYGWEQHGQNPVKILYFADKIGSRRFFEYDVQNRLLTLIFSG